MKKININNNNQVNDDTREIRDLERQLYPIFDPIIFIKKYISLFKMRSHMDDSKKSGLDKAIDVYGEEITKVLNLLEKVYTQELDIDYYKPLNVLDYKGFLQFQIDTIKNIKERVDNGDIKISFDMKKLVDNYYYALAVVGYLIGSLKGRDETEAEAKLDILEKDKNELLRYSGFIFVINRLK